MWDKRRYEDICVGTVEVLVEDQMTDDSSGLVTSKEYQVIGTVIGAAM